MLHKSVFIEKVHQFLFVFFLVTLTYNIQKIVSFFPLIFYLEMMCQRGWKSCCTDVHMYSQETHAILICVHILKDAGVLLGYSL